MPPSPLKVKDSMSKAFWETEAPKDQKTKHLDRKDKMAAKARARAAGRPYPNLVDNAAVARSRKKDK